jgi:hypothetical protein
MLSILCQLGAIWLNYVFGGAMFDFVSIGSEERVPCILVLATAQILNVLGGPAGSLLLMSKPRARSGSAQTCHCCDRAGLRCHRDNALGALGEPQALLPRGSFSKTSGTTYCCTSISGLYLAGNWVYRCWGAMPNGNQRNGDRACSSDTAQMPQSSFSQARYME